MERLTLPDAETSWSDSATSLLYLFDYQHDSPGVVISSASWIPELGWGLPWIPELETGSDLDPSDIHSSLKPEFSGEELNQPSHIAGDKSDNDNQENKCPQDIDGGTKAEISGDAPRARCCMRFCR
jgi:hypothetical protein